MVPQSIKMYPAVGMVGNTVTILKNLRQTAVEITGLLDFGESLTTLLEALWLWSKVKFCPSDVR